MRICPNCRHEANAEGCQHCGLGQDRVDGFRAWAPELARGGVGFKAEYFAGLAAKEAANFWFVARNALIVWAWRRHCPDMSRYLEVGCGTGFVLNAVAEAFPAAQVTGTELFSAGLAFASQRVPRAELLQMNALQMPFADEFDAAGAYDVLEHVEDDSAVLRNFFTALKPGGWLLLSVPQHPWLWGPVDDYSLHQRRYRRGELEQKTTAAGFQTALSSSFVALLLPLMLLSRARSKSSRAFDPDAEYRIHPWLQSLLRWAMGLERLCIMSGLRFPVGGSRLVLVRKPLAQRP